jgi:hypothetical protein
MTSLSGQAKAGLKAIAIEVMSSQHVDPTLPHLSL